MSAEKVGIKDKVMAEAKTMAFVFVYLALFFSAFTAYRRLLLAEYQIPLFHYGYSLIEALVLAKIIVFGRYLRLGERFNDRPLIVPILYKTLWFSLLVLAFSVLEHLLVGWLHGQATGVIVNEVLAKGIWEILARTLVKLFALVPLFAVWEIGRVLGEGKLFALFFTTGTRQPTTGQDSTLAALEHHGTRSTP